MRSPTTDLRVPIHGTSLRIAAAALLLLALPSCVRSAFLCGTPDDCDAKHACVEGTCIRRCDDDSACAGGLRCVRRTGVCTDLPGAAGSSAAVPPASSSGTVVWSTTSGSGPAASSSAPACDASWWNCSYRYRRKIRIGQNLGVPVLAEVPYAVFLPPGTFRRADLRADGSDVRFVAPDGATVLPHELEHFDPDGTTTAWLRTSAAGQDHAWMYWSSPGAPAPAPGEIWSAYAAVWHLDGDVVDSSPAHHGAVNVSGTRAPGPVSGAAAFTSGAHVAVDPADDLRIAGSFTLSAWASFAAFSSEAHANVILSCGAPGNTPETNYLYDFFLSPSLRPTLWWETGWGEDHWVQTEPLSVTTSTWRHLAVVRDQDAMTIAFYAEGALLAEGPYVTLPSGGETAVARLAGNPSDSALYLEGSLDEVRIAARARGADFVQQEYLAQLPGWSAVGAAEQAW